MEIDKHTTAFSRFMGSASVFKLFHDLYHFGLVPVFEYVLDFWNAYFVDVLTFILGLMNIEVTRFAANVLIIYTILFFAHVRRTKLALKLIPTLVLTYFIWPIVVAYSTMFTVVYYARCYRAGRLLPRSMPNDLAMHIAPDFYLEISILLVVFLVLFSFNYMFV
jgi:hypothetical protein